MAPNRLSIHGRVRHHCSDRDHLGSPGRPALAPRCLGAIRDQGLLLGVGIGIGFYFINLLDERQLRRGLGVFLILYALYALATAGGSPMLPSGWRLGSVRNNDAALLDPLAA